MKKSMKDAIFDFAQVVGLSLVPTWRLENHSFEIFLRRLFNLYSIDLVIDVGANRGQYHDFIRYQVGFDGWIVSFEPDPECAATLRHRSIADKKWKIEATALGRQHEERGLNLSMDSHFNSFLRSQEQGAAVNLFQEKMKLSAVQIVEVRTLDSYRTQFEDMGVRSPYLKLDTQGYDLEVLRGASNYLPFIRALQTEASVCSIYEEMPDYRQVLSYLAENEFEWSHSFPVSHDNALRMIEFDLIAVNSRYVEMIATE